MSQRGQFPEQSALGKKSEYSAQYNPDVLFPILRKEKRDEIGVPNTLPFFGFDIWNHYEVSWLNEKGKPLVALAEISYDCASPCIIESKSMKLYFNSLNNTVFNDIAHVETTIKQDLERRVGAAVSVKIRLLNGLSAEMVQPRFQGTSLDDLDIACSVYQPASALLKTEEMSVTEVVCSDLLKSNCLVTGQPDWGSVQISYTGKKISHPDLLRYIVSFRNHNEFHEQCIERIFMDILRQCSPEKLLVYGRYTRRGGLDINPMRSTEPVLTVPYLRLCRQ